MKPGTVFCKYNVILFLILLFLWSCEKNGKLKIVSEALDQVDPSLRSYEIVVVIPNEGCGGCITNTTSFMISNHSAANKKTAVVFTGIRDMKLFKLQLDQKFLSNENVVIDRKNFLRKDGISSIYPQTIILENKKVISINLFDESLFTH